MTPSRLAGAAEPMMKLRMTVAAFPGTGFAVVDGGHFDDLTTCFRRKRLFARSLFLDQVDAEIQEAGPWLVGLDQDPEALDSVLVIVGDKPAVVFWSCSLGEATLFRHLRTINMVRIPHWAAHGNAHPHAVDSPEIYDNVFFRHFDPRVLVTLLPCLDPDQFSRFLGPAEELAFACRDFGLKRAIRDRPVSSIARGTLTIRSEQMQAMIERRVNLSRRRIMEYLRTVAPRETSQLEDHQLLDLVVDCEQSGQGLGLKSEQGLGRWAFVAVKANGATKYQASILAFKSGDPRSAEERVKGLVDLIDREGN